MTTRPPPPPPPRRGGGGGGGGGAVLSREDAAALGEQLRSLRDLARAALQLKDFAAAARYKRRIEQLIAASQRTQQQLQQQQTTTTTSSLSATKTAAHSTARAQEAAPAVAPPPPSPQRKGVLVLEESSTESDNDDDDDYDDDDDDDDDYDDDLPPPPPPPPPDTVPRPPPDSDDEEDASTDYSDESSYDDDDGDIPPPPPPAEPPPPPPPPAGQPPQAHQQVRPVASHKLSPPPPPPSGAPPAQRHLAARGAASQREQTSSRAKPPPPPPPAAGATRIRSPLTARVPRQSPAPPPPPPLLLPPPPSSKSKPPPPGTPPAAAARNSTGERTLDDIDAMLMATFDLSALSVGRSEPAGGGVGAGAVAKIHRQEVLEDALSSINALLSDDRDEPASASPAAPVAADRSDMRPAGRAPAPTPRAPAPTPRARAPAPAPRLGPSAAPQPQAAPPAPPPVSFRRPPQRQTTPAAPQPQPRPPPGASRLQPVTRRAPPPTAMRHRSLPPPPPTAARHRSLPPPPPTAARPARPPARETAAAERARVPPARDGASPPPPPPQAATTSPIPPPPADPTPAPSAAAAATTTTTAATAAAATAAATALPPAEAEPVSTGRRQSLSGPAGTAAGPPPGPLPPSALRKHRATFPSAEPRVQRTVSFLESPQLVAERTVLEPVEDLDLELIRGLGMGVDEAYFANFGVRSRDGTLIATTLEELLSRLADAGPVDHVLRHEFLLSFRLVMGPRRLLSVMLDRLSAGGEGGEGGDSATAKRVQRNAAAFVVAWLQEHYTDFAREKRLYQMLLRHVIPRVAEIDADAALAMRRTLAFRFGKKEPISLRPDDPIELIEAAFCGELAESTQLLRVRTLSGRVFPKCLRGKTFARWWRRRFAPGEDGDAATEAANSSGGGGVGVGDDGGGLDEAGRNAVGRSRRRAAVGGRTPAKLVRELMQRRLVAALESDGTMSAKGYHEQQLYTLLRFPAFDLGYEPALALRDIDNLTLEAIPPAELARHICLAMWMKYRRISLDELSKFVRNSCLVRRQHSVRILAFLALEQEVACWIADEITRRESPAEQAETIRRFLRVGDALLRYHNFAGVSAVLAALAAPAVWSLDAAWTEVRRARKHQKAYEKLRALTWTQLCDRARRARAPYVPCVRSALRLLRQTFRGLGTLTIQSKRQLEREMFEAQGGYGLSAHERAGAIGEVLHETAAALAGGGGREGEGSPIPVRITFPPGFLRVAKTVALDRSVTAAGAVEAILGQLQGEDEAVVSAPGDYAILLAGVGPLAPDRTLGSYPEIRPGTELGLRRREGLAVTVRFPAEFAAREQRFLLDPVLTAAGAVAEILRSLAAEDQRLTMDPGALCLATAQGGVLGDSTVLRDALGGGKISNAELRWARRDRDRDRDRKPRALGKRVIASLRVVSKKRASATAAPGAPTRHTAPTFTPVNLDRVDTDGLVNWARMRPVADIFDDVIRGSREPYPFEGIPSILAFLDRGIGDTSGGDDDDEDAGGPAQERFAPGGATGAADSDDSATTPPPTTKDWPTPESEP